MTGTDATDGPANALRRAFSRALADRGDPDLAPFVGALDALTCHEAGPGDTGTVPEAGAGVLSALLDGLGCDPPLATAIRDFAPGARWYRMLEGAPVDPLLVRGLMVGRPDLPDDAPHRLGLFLIMPGVHYPLHQHGAIEVYHVVAGRIVIQHGCTGTGLTVEPGGYSITPGNRVHALTTDAEPCLIAYCWTGDVAAPGWWWAPAAGGWERTHWVREPSGRWHPAGTEPVGEATWREAGEPPVS